jgi:hypothetical protein
MLGLGAATSLAADIYVDWSGSGDYTTIQAAINAANAGDVIHVAAGTYNERPSVNKSLTITGADEATVIIDAGAGASGTYGFTVTANGVTISDLTLIGDTSLSTPRYGFKISSVSNFTLTNVTGKEFYRTAVDLLGVTNGVLMNVTSIDNDGHGISVLDCNNVTLTNTTMSGNAWQGVSVATWGRYSTLGTSGIVFQGTNSFVDPFQLEMGDYYNPGVPPAGAAIITYSTNPADLADVTVLAIDYGYAVHGEQDDSPGQVRIWFAPTLADAALLPAMAPIGHFTGNDMYIESLTDGTQFYATPGCSIQAAIDAASSGDSVDVLAGTYREQLKIDGKSLDLTGAGVGATILEAVDLVDRTTYSITQWTGSPRTIDACIGVTGAGTVDITDMTVDGRDLGPDNFYGIHFFDTSGSVTDCRIEDIEYPGSAGAQKVVSLVATQSAAAASYTIDFSDNVIPNFQKGGVLVMGPDITFTVNGNDITDVPSTAIAGNGIQLSYGATGTTSGNVVQGVGYSGTDWSGSGILLFESGNVSMDGDEVHNCETGVNFSDWGWIYLHPSQVALDFVGLNLHDNEWTLGVQLSRDYSDVDIDITDCLVIDNAGDGIDLFGTSSSSWYAGWDNGSLTARIDGCTITNTTIDGIWVDDLSGNANNVDVSVHQTGFWGNTGSALWNGQSHEIDAEYCWWDDPAGPTVITEPPRANQLAAPHVSPYGADLPEQGEVRYAESSTSRAGDGVSTNVDYTPWLTGNVVCVPDPLDLVVGSTTGSIDVDYLGGGGGLLYGYSVTVTWDDSVADLTGITEGSLLSDAGGTNFFYYGTGGTRTIDCALTGGSAGVTGPGTLFTLSFTEDNSGTSTVVLSPVAFRDNVNAPLSGFYVDDGLINVDVTGPVFTGVSLANLTLGHTDDYAKNADDLELKAYVTDDYSLSVGDIVADLSGLISGGGTAVVAQFYSSGVATWTTALANVTLTTPDALRTVTVTATDWLGNSASGSDGIIVDNTLPGTVAGLAAAPAHEEVVLSWSDASGADANYYGVMVRYDVWSDYPLYDLPDPAPYPGDETEGVLAFSGVGTGTTFGVVPRDIHYFSAFVYDWALNYGGVDAGGQDRSTNYWLGDVANVANNWTPDGLVTGADINKLGTLYGGAPSGNELKCDVGPTDDHSRVGIPEPDDMLNFEDLMIFAMNYGVVSAKVVPLLGEPGVGDLALALTENGRSNDGVVELALRLEGNLGEVKGLTAELEFEGLEFLSARLSDDMSVPVADMFFWSNATSRGVQVDAAVLGTDVTIGGSGDVVLFTFQVLDETYSVDFTSAQLRGAGNEDLTAELEGLSSEGVPVAFRLVQNSPNPFNPVTKVAYHVPSASRVTIRVFDVTGRLVTTLVDGVVEPGRHTAVWNGTNDAGESVGSGVYFCTMETPDYSSSHKMTLLK